MIPTTVPSFVSFHSDSSIRIKKICTLYNNNNKSRIQTISLFTVIVIKTTTQLFNNVMHPRSHHGATTELCSISFISHTGSCILHKGTLSEHIQHTISSRFSHTISTQVLKISYTSLIKVINNKHYLGHPRYDMICHVIILNSWITYICAIHLQS